MSKAVAALLLTWTAGGACAQGPQSAMLERVVLVQRHGVRSPTKPPEALAGYASQPWPAWPVAPGELTAHGAAGVALMGGWLRTHYAALGLLSGQACPAQGAVAVWADGADQRTRVSGQKFLDGGFPGCGLTAASGVPGMPDPIFSSLEAGAAKLDAAQAQAALRAALAAPGVDETAGKQALAAVLYATPAGCASTAEGCFLDQPDGVKISKGTAKLTGALATAASLAEDLGLEYEQGFEGTALGWGRVTPANLVLAMRLHNRAAAIERSTPAIAAASGRGIAQVVAQALAGSGRYAGARLVLFDGHDTNLSNLAGILGLEFLLQDQFDDTPPEATLAFEEWKTAQGDRQIRIRYFYPTDQQLRGGMLAGGARELDLPAPGDVLQRLERRQD